MKPYAIESQARAKRYLVVLEDETKKSISNVESQLNVQLISSSELNSKNRAFNIMNENKGIFYKNLNIAVVDQVPVSTLNRAVSDPKSPILYWEEEREYKIANELDLINGLKSSVIDFQRKLDQLENIIKERSNNHEKVWDNATWGLLALGMPKSIFSGKGVKVAILDTGLYTAHPDFSGRTIEGKSFIQGEQWDKDGNGHGTHCTGTALGEMSNDEKRYGVAYDADIFIGKVLSDQGSGSTSQIVDAIDWALEKGCKVISMSLGSPVNVGENPSLIFERAGEKALESGCLIIAAAGNDSNRPDRVRPVSSPANAQSILAVAAIDKALNVASFSNAGLNVGTGGRIDLSAPGVDVFSSFSKNAPGEQLYKRLNGTSMATPHIAGLAALYWEAMPHLSASEIWRKLEENAKNLDHLNLRDVGFGLGQVIINEE